MLLAETIMKLLALLIYRYHKNKKKHKNVQNGSKSILSFGH